MLQGTVVNLNTDKGYGFIRPQGQKKGKDLFFHATGMVNRSEFAELEVDQEVRYDLDDSGDRPRAVSVQAVPD